MSLAIDSMSAVMGMREGSHAHKGAMPDYVIARAVV